MTDQTTLAGIIHGICDKGGMTQHGPDAHLDLAARLLDAGVRVTGDAGRCGDDSWDTRYECVKPKGHPVEGPGLTSHEYRYKRAAPGSAPSPDAPATDWRVLLAGIRVELLARSRHPDVINRVVNDCEAALTNALRRGEAHRVAPSPDAPAGAARCICSHPWSDHMTWCYSSGCPCRFTPAPSPDALREADEAVYEAQRDALDVEREAVVEAMERDGVVTWGDDGHRERFLAMLPVHLARIAREYAALATPGAAHIGCQFNHAHRWPECYDAATEDPA